jgi:hypothetical protein
MILNRRLDKLEASLSPEQIFRRWLAETLKFKSRREYMMWVAQDQQARHPFGIFHRHLNAVATSKTWEKASEHWKRLLRAQETLRVSFYQFDGVNETVERQLEHSLSGAYPVRSEVEFLVNDLLQPLALMPLPLSEDVAAMVGTALENYVISEKEFCDELSRWIGDYCNETTVNETATGLEKRLAKWKEVRRSCFEIGAIKWGYQVELGPFPYRSLGAASLVDGRWIDTRILELAEFAALLVSRGFRPQDPPDRHPLAPLPFVNWEGLPPSEQELLNISNELESRLRQFKGTKQNIRGQVYADVDDYRSWTGRAVMGELTPKRGINVGHWNRWHDSRGGRALANIAGVKVHRLEAPFNSSDFVASEDQIELVFRRKARGLVLRQIHGTGIPGTAARPSRSQVRESVMAALIAVLASRELVNRMERQFGHHVIFRETEEQVAKYITFWEGMVNRFNKTSPHSVEARDLNKSKSAWSRIDLDSAEISAKKRSEILFNSISDRAEAQALQSLGRRPAAMKIISKLIAKNTPASTDGAQAPPEPKAPKPPDPLTWGRFLAYSDKLDREMKAKADKKKKEEKEKKE